MATDYTMCLCLSVQTVLQAPANSSAVNVSIIVPSGTPEVNATTVISTLNDPSTNLATTVSSRLTAIAPVKLCITCFLLSIGVMLG